MKGVLPTVFLLVALYLCDFSYQSGNTTIADCFIDEVPYIVEYKIDVFYAEAALFKSSMGDLLYNFRLFHGGLLYIFRGRDIGDGKNCTQATIEYVGTPSVFASLLPSSIDDTHKQINWTYGGEVILNDTFAENYWDRLTFVSRIDSVIFNQLLCWVPTVGAPPYQLFQVFSQNSVPNGPFSQVLQSTTCVDFVWQQFNALYDLGASLYNLPQVGKTNVQLFGYNYVNVTLNATNYQEIADYFNDLELIISKALLNESIEEILEQFFDLYSDGVAYVHYGVDKYMKVNLTSPYVKVSYDTNNIVPLRERYVKNVNITNEVDVCLILETRTAYDQVMMVHVSTVITVVIALVTIVAGIVLAVGLFIYLIYVFWDGYRKGRESGPGFTSSINSGDIESI